MNTNIIPADKRHFTDMGWLQTYWLFSFSNYYDPANMGHGKLEAGRQLQHHTSVDRTLFIYQTSGSLRVNGETLADRDQARIDGVELLELESDKDSDFILIDV